MLIKCPECGKEVTDTITACIHCGYELNKPYSNDNDDIKDTDSIQDTTSILTIKNSENNETRLSDSKKSTKKKLIIICASISLIVIVAVVIVIIFKTSLNSKEQYAYDVISKYSSSLKDPDSLIIRGDIMYYQSDSAQYVAFISTATNSYGGKVTSTPMFKGYSYLGDYEDDSDDIEDKEKAVDFARGKYIVAHWNLTRYLGEEDTDYELISGKKIADKLNCEWRE